MKKNDELKTSVEKYKDELEKHLSFVKHMIAKPDLNEFDLKTIELAIPMPCCCPPYCGPGREQCGPCWENEK